MINVKRQVSSSWKLPGAFFIYPFVFCVEYNQLNRDYCQ